MAAPSATIRSTCFRARSTPSLPPSPAPFPAFQPPTLVTTLSGPNLPLFNLVVHTISSLLARRLPLGYPPHLCRYGIQDGLHFVTLQDLVDHYRDDRDGLCCKIVRNVLDTNNTGRGDRRPTYNDVEMMRPTSGGASTCWCTTVLLWAGGGSGC